MEELDAQDRMGFSANRFKDISFGVVQSQTSSMFSGSFMSDQSSQGKAIELNSQRKWKVNTDLFKQEDNSS